MITYRKSDRKTSDECYHLQIQPEYTYPPIKRAKLYDENFNCRFGKNQCSLRRIAMLRWKRNVNWTNAYHDYVIIRGKLRSFKRKQKPWVNWYWWICMYIRPLKRWTYKWMQHRHHERDQRCLRKIASVVSYNWW